MGFDRATLLGELSARSDSRLIARGRAIGLARRGRKARQIGPLFAEAPEQALALIDDIVRSEPGPVADRCHRQAGRRRSRPDGARLDYRAGVPTDALRHFRSSVGGAADGRRRAGIWIREHAMHHSQIEPDVRRLIAQGTVIPAHPLALDARRALDPTHQRALTRYYIDAGSGGLAVGVHTTQFAIREAGLYAPVLELAAETAASWTTKPLALVAGLAGPTRQAVAEPGPRSRSVITPDCSVLPR